MFMYMYKIPSSHCTAVANMLIHVNKMRWNWLFYWRKYSAGDWYLFNKP